MSRTRAKAAGAAAGLLLALVVLAQPGDHGVRVPMAAGRVIPYAGAAQAAAIAPQQIGRHATFVQKHVLPHIAQRLPRPPLAPGRRDIRPALLVGVYRFF